MKLALFCFTIITQLFVFFGLQKAVLPQPFQNGCGTSSLSLVRYENVYLMIVDKETVF